MGHFEDQRTDDVKKKFFWDNRALFVQPPKNWLRPRQVGVLEYSCTTRTMWFYWFDKRSDDPNSKINTGLFNTCNAKRYVEALYQLEQ